MVRSLSLAAALAALLFAAALFYPAPISPAPSKPGDVASFYLPERPPLPVRGVAYFSRIGAMLQ